MIDKHTFGGTTAAEHLADRLQRINNPKFTRKISARMERISFLIEDLRIMYEALENTSDRNFQFIKQALYREIEETANIIMTGSCYTYRDDSLPDRTCVDLMQNVLKARVSDFIREVSE